MSTTQNQLPTLPAWTGAPPGGPGCAGEPGGPPRALPPLPDLRSVEHVHLVGVGGTGMGTFAGMLKAAGYRVSGSDEKVYPPMSDVLEGWGIQVREPYGPDNLSDDPDLVIVGNVCRRDNPEAAAVRERGLAHCSFPRALASMFLEGRHSVVVAGTHGKTTTTSLLGVVLAEAGRDPGVLVGGLVRDFDASFRLGEGAEFVVEGDEYDSAYYDKGPKLFHYGARTAVLTNVEFDHADIYANLAQVEYVFARFVAMIPKDGLLAYCLDDPGARRIAEQHAHCQLRSYGLAREASVRAEEVRFREGGVSFELVVDDVALGRLESPLTGEHNLRNTLGMAAVAISLGVSCDALRPGLLGFQGVAKRQEVVGEVGGVVVVDDFAHHPTAVRETIAALRLRYPGRRLVVAFEAKSNTSRMNVFHQAYVEALSGADVVIIARPYVKRDNIPEERRLDVEVLMRDLNTGGAETHLIPEVSEILTFLENSVAPGDVVAGLSGSAFGGLHRQLVERLRSRGLASLSMDSSP